MERYRRFKAAKIGYKIVNEKLQFRNEKIM